MIDFDELDKVLICEIQGDIPISADPYGDIAQKIGYQKQDVLNRLKYYAEQGYVKRVSAVLHHRYSGFSVNGMFASKVDSEKVEVIGKKLAQLPQVTHCYERRTYNEWPYNLYAMIHGTTKIEVEQIVKNFSKEMGIKDYNILYSINEFKKSSMKFF